MSGDGNNLVVGVPFEDSNGSSAGSAYVFTRSGETWSQQAKIQASDAAANQEFAYSVDMSTDGNTIALGSRDDTGGTNRGAAYIFTRSGSTWSQQAKLENANEADYDIFAGGGRGVSLSGSGNVLVVGAYGDDDNGSQSGSTFVFTRSGTTWSQAKQIATSDAAASDENGFAVAIDKNGDTILTGSYGKTSSTGAAYIWTAPLAVQLQDTLTLEAGSNITITTDANTDTVTIAASSAIDSAGTIALIDSAYVQARQTTGTDSAATISLIQANSVDSAEVINLIDSAYVAARTTAGTDSAAIINLIDSNYVQARQTTGTDSAAVSAIIINDVDTAYIAARANDIILQIDSDLTTTDSAQVVHSFNKTTYRTMKYTAQLENDDTNSYHAEEILLTHDGTNIAISSYAKITLDSDLGEFDAQINGNNVELILTPSKVNTHVKLRAITMSEGAAYSSGLIVAVDSDLTTTDSAQTIHTFDKTTYRTMKYVAQLGNTNGYHAQELLLTHNGTNVALTGYAKILLDSELGTFDALINGNNVELKVSPTYANTNVRLRAIRTLA